MENRLDDIRTLGIKPGKAREYLIDMVKALHYCHREIGLIHRDIKPENIMINHNDEAVLVDFGISAIPGVTDRELLQNKIGTYTYFAPELFNIRDDYRK